MKISVWKLQVLNYSAVTTLKIKQNTFLTKIFKAKILIFWTKNLLRVIYKNDEDFKMKLKNNSDIRKRPETFDQ